MRIVNPVLRRVSIQGGRVSSTKRDKRNHGYGIDIMKRIADKYSGSCTLHCDKQEFTVNISVLTRPEI